MYGPSLLVVVLVLCSELESRKFSGFSVRSEVIFIVPYGKVCTYAHITEQILKILTNAFFSQKRYVVIKCCKAVVHACHR